VTQAATAAVTAVAVAAVIVLAQPSNDAPVAARPPITVAPDLVPATTGRATAPSASALTIAPSTAACPPAAPLDQLDPATTPLGCPGAPTVLTVTDVPADEGFWATTSTGADVWVQLVGHGESPIEIVAGSPVAVSGATGDPASIGTIASDRIAGGGWLLLVDFADLTEA
jgi:hypothetical protein